MNVTPDQLQQPASPPLTLLAPVAVARRTSLSWRTIQRKVRSEPDFPKPRKVSEGRIGFIEAEVEAWIASRPVTLHAEAA
jgi:predicted DNA-binding transcriptional regulator AlpA